MKKSAKLSSLLLLSLVVSSFMVSFASADVASNVAQGVTGAIDVLKAFLNPIFGALLGGTTEGSSFVLQILAFLLVTIIIYGTLSSINFFGEQKWISFAIGMIVSLIGIRFLPEGLLESMAIPSSALVATLVLVVPLILLTILGLKIQDAIIRKIYYIAYACIVVFLWFYNWENTSLDGFRWIYPLVAVLTLVMLWFDGTLQNWFYKGRAKRVEADQKDSTRMQIVGEIRNLQSALAAATTPADIRRITAQIRAKEAALAAL